MLIFETMFDYVLGGSLITTRIVWDDVSSLCFLLHFTLCSVFHFYINIFSGGY